MQCADLRTTDHMYYIWKRKNSAVEFYDISRCVRQKPRKRNFLGKFSEQRASLECFWVDWEKNFPQVTMGAVI